MVDLLGVRYFNQVRSKTNWTTCFLPIVSLIERDLPFLYRDVNKYTDSIKSLKILRFRPVV